MKTHIAEAHHEEIYQKLILILREYANQASAIDVLAVACNIVGKLIAMQDQRTFTREMAIELLMANVEMGNKQVIDHLKIETGGKA